MTILEEIRKSHRDRMEALKLREHTSYNREELIRLYNQNIERAFEYGKEAAKAEADFGVRGY